MDPSQITDIKELKSAAYDVVASIQQQQQYLGLINQRITELSQSPATFTTPDDATA